MVSLHFRSEVRLGSCFRRGRGTRALRIEGELIFVWLGGALDPAVGAPETAPGARESAPSAEAASGRSVILAGRAGGRGMGGGWQGCTVPGRLQCDTHTRPST